MLADPTQKLLQELPQARNLRDLCLILAHYTRALPFSRVAFDLDVQHSLLPVDENGELLGVELGWSPEFIRRWVESGYNLACPLVTPCKLRRWPFTWGLDEENLGVDPKWLERPFTAIGQQTISVLKEVGVRSGIIVPVHQPGGRTGFVSWVSEEPLAEIGIHARVNEGYGPVVDVRRGQLDGAPALAHGEVVGIGLVVVQEEILDDLGFVPERQDELGVSEVCVVLHDVPQDGPLSHRHHRLGHFL